MEHYMHDTIHFVIVKSINRQSKEHQYLTFRRKEDKTKNSETIEH